MCEFVVYGNLPAFIIVPYRPPPTIQDYLLPLQDFYANQERDVSNYEMIMYLNVHLVSKRKADILKAHNMYLSIYYFEDDWIFGHLYRSSGIQGLFPCLSKYQHGHLGI